MQTDERRIQEDETQIVKFLAKTDKIRDEVEQIKNG